MIQFSLHCHMQCGIVPGGGGILNFQKINLVISKIGISLERLHVDSLYNYISWIRACEVPSKAL